MASVNKDLVKERKSATFDKELLTEILYNGKEGVKRRRYLQNIAIQDPYLKSLTPWWNRDRETHYDIALKKAVYLNQLMEKMNITAPIDTFILREAAACQENNPLGLHQVMFIPTIEKQGTKEQIEKFLPPARAMKYIGTYAQTELGHGTFIRGLETTATYDPKTEEFIINSPTLTSMKYWPGSLGKTSNHVILMAQLHSQGKNHGIHAFVVQIRSLEDHRPLPGITVGDIGNKLGYEGMDNGFLMFNNVRVPRDAMLMRYSRVERDGTYVPPKNAKIAYGSMVFIRAMIVGDMGRSLAQASVIAIRYSAVRRQTEIRPGGEEPQVIDYQTQQEKLFPLLAASYAYIFMGYHMAVEYFRVTAEIERGNMEEMQSLHALAAGLKALSSDLASSGVDRLRVSCGGHGYSLASGLPKIFTNITPAMTYEGENTVMYLQCARYLIKMYAQVASGQQLSGFMSYLSNKPRPHSGVNEALQLEDLIELYEHAASRLIQGVAMKMQSLMKSGKPEEVARNMCSVQMVQASKMHSAAYVVRTFAMTIQAKVTDLNLAKVMTTLCQVFAVDGILQKTGYFLMDGFLSGKQAQMLAERQMALFAEIRPNAVALVDAFDYPDEVLQSCLGRYDGNVYEALFEYAKNSPLNKADVLPSYHTVLKPLIQGESSAPAARL